MRHSEGSCGICNLPPLCFGHQAACLEMQKPADCPCDYHKHSPCVPTLDTWHREEITETWGWVVPAVWLSHPKRYGTEAQLRVKLPGGGQCQRLRAEHKESALGSRLWGPCTPRMNGHRMTLLCDSASSTSHCAHCHSQADGHTRNVIRPCFSSRKEGTLSGKRDDHVQPSCVVYWAMHYLPMLQWKSALWRDYVPHSDVPPHSHAGGRVLPGLLWRWYSI